MARRIKILANIAELYDLRSFAPCTLGILVNRLCELQTNPLGQGQTPGEGMPPLLHVIPQFTSFLSPVERNTVCQALDHTYQFLFCYLPYRLSASSPVIPRSSVQIVEMQHARRGASDAVGSEKFDSLPILCRLRPCALCQPSVPRDEG